MQKGRGGARKGGAHGKRRVEIKLNFLINDIQGKFERYLLDRSCCMVVVGW